MAEVKAAVIPQEYVMEVWPEVKGFIFDAIKHTHGRFLTEDVLESLLSGHWQLWVAFEGPNIIGCVVTYFEMYPRLKVLSCPFVTGKDFDKWKYPMFHLLQRWARDNQCAKLESTARLGWARKFKDDGYEAIWQTFQLPVEDEDEEEVSSG
jgi:hypothetical protein